MGNQQQQQTDLVLSKEHKDCPLVFSSECDLRFCLFKKKKRGRNRKYIVARRNLCLKGNGCVCWCCLRLLICSGLIDCEEKGELYPFGNVWALSTRSREWLAFPEKHKGTLQNWFLLTEQMLVV